MYINEINNEKKFDLNLDINKKETNSNNNTNTNNTNNNISNLNTYTNLITNKDTNKNNNSITKLNFNIKFAEVKIINDYENVFEGNEMYILYPYFFDFDSKFKINQKMKTEILLNPDSLQKCVLSVYDEDQEFDNVTPINERIFENFKILDFEKIGENCFRYNLLEDAYLNNSNNINNKNYDNSNPNNNKNYNKQSYNYKNIIMDIIKKKEADLILNHSIGSICDKGNDDKIKLKRQLTKRLTLNL
jgi:hypothetical protein